MFKPAGEGINEQIVAGVNGKLIFEKTSRYRLLADKTGTVNKDAASSFFNTIGKEILLQTADAKTVVVQPHEVEAEIQAIMTSKGVAPSSS